MGASGLLFPTNTVENITARQIKELEHSQRSAFHSKVENEA
jgi:hypothetical protein